MKTHAAPRWIPKSYTAFQEYGYDVPFIRMRERVLTQVEFLLRQPTFETFNETVAHWNRENGFGS